MPRHKNARRRGTRRQHNNHGRSTASTIGIIAGLGVFVTGALGAGAFFALEKMNEKVLDVAYCYPSESGEDRYVASYFVDFSFTTQVSPSQKRDLINTVTEEYDRLPANGQLYLFSTASDITASVVKPSFTICRPAKNKQEQSGITGAPDKLPTVLAREHRDAREAFIKELEALLQDASDPSKAANRSPILAQFRGISRFNYGASLDRFVAYTDGIENSNIARFCVKKGHLPSFAKFAERRDYQEIRLDDLSDVDVEFYQLRFGPLPNNQLPFCSYPELVDFYKGYFKDANAANIRVTPLGLGAS